MADLEFDLAVDGDWPAIWPIFHAVASGGDTYPYLPDTSEAAARSLWMQPREARRATYVARLDGRVVATAYVKPNQVGRGDHVANAGWMVAPDSRGMGIGRRFARYVIDEAGRLGYHGMQFNSVVASNEAAVRLWISLGFEIVGTVPDAFRHVTEGLTPVHVMYRRLADPSGPSLPT